MKDVEIGGSGTADWGGGAFPDCFCCVVYGRYYHRSGNKRIRYFTNLKLFVIATICEAL